MGWFAIYTALKENLNVKNALKTNMPDQMTAAFDIAAEKLVQNGLPFDGAARAKVIYWFRRHGYDNPYKNGLRKISDETKQCISPQHNPPTHLYLQGGTYEYVCPVCNKKTTFIVPTITF